MEKRIKLREEIWKEAHGDCSERDHKRITRIEIVYNKSQSEMIYLAFTDNKGNLQKGVLTTLNFKDLHHQSTTQNRLYFYNVVTDKIATMDTSFMPRYMSIAEIMMYRGKLGKEEKERIAKMEKK